MTTLPERLPLFPLKTVLFPGGVLPLRVFEPRYMDMITRCMREDAGFGVCLIAAGEEVGETAVPHPVGTEARIEQWDMAQAGVLNLLTRGSRRFDDLRGHGLGCPTRRLGRGCACRYRRGRRAGRCGARVRACVCVCVFARAQARLGFCFYHNQVLL